MIRERETKRATPLILFGWLVSLGCAVLALGVLRVFLTPFDIQQGLDLIKLLLIGIIFACIFGFVCGLSMGVYEKQNWGGLKIIVYWLGVGLIFGAFIVMCPRFLKETIDLGFSILDTVIILIIGLTFCGILARWSLKPMG